MNERPSGATLTSRRAGVLFRSDVRGDEDTITGGARGRWRGAGQPRSCTFGRYRGCERDTLSCGGRGWARAGSKNSSVFDRPLEDAVDQLVGEFLVEVGGDTSLRPRAIADGSRSRLDGSNLRSQETRSAETETYKSSTYEDE